MFWANSAYSPFSRSLSHPPEATLQATPWPLIDISGTMTCLRGCQRLTGAQPTAAVSHSAASGALVA